MTPKYTMKPGQFPILSPMRSLGKRGRVLAPFRAPYDPQKPKSWDRRETFYCHHYRQEGEHYHKTLAELEQCQEQNYD